MRIVFLSPHPGFGGASTANRCIAEMLGHLGHDVIYLDEYGPNSDSNNYSLDRFPIHQSRIKTRRAAQAYIEGLKPDVVFLGAPIIGLYYLPLLKRFRKKGVRIISIIHSQSLSTGLSAKFDEFEQLCAAKYSSDMVFVSEYTKNYWMKYRVLAKKQIHVVYNAIKDQGSMKDERGNDKFKVIFVGRLSNEKNPNLFCQVAKKMKAIKPDIQFEIFGDGNLMDDINKEYSDVVTLRGFIKDANDIYADSNLLLMTSRFENCPMAILEAASYGVPCVAPKVGGIPEIVNDRSTGYLFDDYSVDDIVDGLNAVKDDYSRYSKNAKQQSLKYSMQAIEKQWEMILAK